MTSKGQRAAAMAQVLASTWIFGHEPTETFLVDCARYVDGTATTEQLLQAARNRALTAQAERQKPAQPALPDLITTRRRTPPWTRTPKSSNRR